MGKGILVVSFGTSYKETSKKCIESIENKIESVYVKYIVKRAFTSDFIIKKIKERDGICIDTPLEALEKMIVSGINEIHVQPLHIIPGFEYEKIKRAVVLVKHRHNVKITIGSPLLNREEHYDQVIEALINRLPNENDNEGIILMGHGTEHFSNACYSMLQNKINDKRKDILIANVEGYPEIENIMKKIKGKYLKILLMPLMIVAGDHANNDMAGDEDSYKTKLESQNIQVSYILEGLGQNEMIQDIFINRIAEFI
ncbi:MAG: sirohydrochlorin cobaltochelatase [Bacillota bacterium]|nr:sirohydrochlorin cobaltochelatase [Bacillota bacterium]